MPLDDQRDQLTDQEYQIVKNRLKEYDFSYAKRKWLHDVFNKKSKIKNILTFNGWIFPADRDKIAVISSTESPYTTYRKRKIFLMEPISQRGIVCKKSYVELIKALTISFKTYKLVKKQFNSEKEIYIKSSSKITNIDSWKRYLSDNSLL